MTVWDYRNRMRLRRERTRRNIGILIAFLVATLFIWAFLTVARATWKPEYASNPPAVTAWFKEARVAGGCDSSDKARAWHRLGICGCCENADRLRTKFVAAASGDWSYYPDPNCTTKGCALKPIPDDVVHEDEIHAANGFDDTLPEFDAMRREGVLFIYQGEPSCFWPPDRSDN